MPKVEIYTKPWCPYCTYAKRIFDQKNIDYTEIGIGQDMQKREEMIARSQGYTVPQIFIDDKAIGGCDDLVAAQRSGLLDKLLQPAGSPVQQ